MMVKTSKSRGRRRLVLFLLLFLGQQSASADEAEEEKDDKKGYTSKGEHWLIRLSRRLLTGKTRRDLLRVCYGRYGCFSVDWPWFSSRRVVNSIPKSPRAIRPRFFLYTRLHPTRHQDLVEGDVALLANSDFRSDRLTFVITHGYLEHGKKNWLQEMKDELLRHGDHNVIIIDWLAASRPPYTQAVANVRLIGAMTAHLLAFLARTVDLDLLRVHLVGHSLGAHLGGYAGDYLKRRWSLTLGRITGLDPAEPHFEWAHPMTRLDEGDAYFVDIIHTDSNPILSFGLGMLQPCGHLDFYPNGGKVMAGCDGTFVGSLAQENGSLPFAFRRLIGCNHYRSYEYFTESINSDCPFIAVRCPSWSAFVTGQCNGCLVDGDPDGCEFMGFKAFATLNGSRPRFKNRSLYLMTEPSKPFCSSPYRVTLLLSDTRESLRRRGDRGNFYLRLHGEGNSTSSKVLLNEQEIFFEAGREYKFMMTARGLGHLHFAELTWQFSYHPFNPLTWRLFGTSKIFLNRIEVDHFGGDRRYVFCAQDRPIYSGVPKKVEWMPNCRENKPDPGATFLGAFLNSDPVGNAEFLLHQVNPLAMNPLNGLSNLGSAFRDLAEGVRRAGAAVIRRAGGGGRGSASAKTTGPP